ncbi:MAG: DUF4159 domain-containing protein [Longimicrobiales bacterium]
MSEKDLKRSLSRVFLWPGIGLAVLTGMVFGAPMVWGVSRGIDTAETAVRAPVFLAPPSPRHEFYFTRAIYSSGRGWGRGGRGSWATDYPKADRQFLVVIKKLLGLDAYDFENAVSLADPEIRRYPFLYALEVGRMALTQAEIHGLRGYLNAGGFLVIDDFWGTREWEVFSYNMRMVLPGRPMVELPLDHDLFHTFFEIDEIKQVPNVRQGRYGGPTWERDGYEPRVLGIYDDDGRLMVVINWNTDLGDAWEWAEDPFYPMEYSNFAYEMGANLIIYAMSH